MYREMAAETNSELRRVISGLSLQGSDHLHHSLPARERALLRIRLLITMTIQSRFKEAVYYKG